MGEVRVRVHACGGCHSDVALLAGAYGGELPAVYGHEAAGVVTEVGSDVTSVTPGEHVVVGLVRSCGRCAACRRGEPALCAARFRLDAESPISLADGRRAVQGVRCGAFADEIVVHASQAVAVPPDLPAASACLIACAVVTGLGAVERSGAVAPGANVVVVGAGGVGLNAVQGAALAGAGMVVAVDVSPGKLRAAEAFGATHVLTAGPDLPDRVRELTGGHGADAVLATVGAGAAIEQGLALLARGGTLVVVGMPASGVRVSFEPAQLAHDGQRIVGSKLGTARPHEDVPRIVELYRQGRLRLDELVTATYPLEAIDDAVASTRRGEAVRN